MYGHGSNDVRFAAETLYQNAPHRQPLYPSMDLPRSTSQNWHGDEYLEGYTQDGRMSNVRRFFCIFVTFDLFFVSLLWLICVLITGADFFDVLKDQILHFDVHKSTFDIVMSAICRFVVLLLFYALISLNHWCIIALSTAGSCAFLIYKVFAFNWVDQNQPVFQVLLIIVSFVLAWGEIWWFDFRLIPQETFTRRFLSMNYPNLYDDRAPLFGDSHDVNDTFHSPFESIHNSNEDLIKLQNEEYIKIGKECVLRAIRLLEMGSWKLEKTTPVGDKIQSINDPKIGKVWRCTARIELPAKLLLEHLFKGIEQIHKWDQTILESKIIHKIDKHTDITYQATAGAGNGLIKSRDFVNLRCWHLCRDGKIVDPADRVRTPSPPLSTISDRSSSAESNHSFSDALNGEPIPSPGVTIPSPRLNKSLSITRLNENLQKASPSAFGLSKSVGASGFYQSTPNDDSHLSGLPTNNVYVSSARSIESSLAPETGKYTRADNLLSCWAMREIYGNPDSCDFEWLMCIDLKGSLWSSVLNSVYPTIMQDFMQSLRKHCDDIRANERPSKM